MQKMGMDILVLLAKIGMVSAGSLLISLFYVLVTIEHIPPPPPLDGTKREKKKNRTGVR